MMLREEGMNQVQPSFQEAFSEAGRSYGQIYRVRAVRPQRLSAKGCWCEIWWCRSQKELGFLMVVTITSRGLSCLTTGRLQTHSRRAFPLQVQSRLARAVVFGWNEHCPWGPGF